jgi:iron complex outermembrane receptor protein
MLFKKCKYLFLSLVFLLFNRIDAQDTLTYKLNDIFVTSSRSPVSFSDLSRSVKVISAEEIKTSPSNSISDLLQFTAGVDLRQRGIEGVQADVSIRGGSFEQVLILIDGVPFNDPQTGHHNMNIPLALEDISRIEILKGQGSKIFGPNALSGAINIITKKNTGKSLSVKVSGGENAFQEEYLGGSYNIGNTALRLSANRKRSDGFQPNSDFKFENYTGNLNYSGTIGSANLLFGYLDKSFGANGFYASNAEWERIITRFFSFAGEIGNKNFYLSPKIYFRQNVDDYVYLRTDPSFYRNNHTSFSYGSELQFTYKLESAVVSVGGKFEIDSLKSNRLGDHKREKFGFFGEISFSPIEPLSVNIGSFVYKYADIGWKFWPGIDASYKLNEYNKFYASFGKAFRLPTYTELYYISKSTHTFGNPDLKSEQVTNYEVGFSRRYGFYTFDLSLFRKEGENNIDWVDTYNDTTWYATNFAKVNTNGVEITIGLLPVVFKNIIPGTGLILSYVYMDSDKNTDGKLSRDYLETMRHQFVADLNNKFNFGLNTNIKLRYEDRLNLNDIFLVDGNIAYDWNQFEIFVKVSNIFGKRYKKHLFAELPGRWIIAGLKFELSDN